MSPYQGRHSEQDVSVDISGDHTELRRNFLDKIAYLCDTAKLGGTVTAAAMQKERGFSILHLAANEDIKLEVRSFILRTLEKLRGVISDTSEIIMKDVLLDALPLAKQRIVFYQEQMLGFADQSRKKLKKMAVDERGKIFFALRHRHPIPNPLQSG